MMFDLKKIRHLTGIDHPESLGVGPHGEIYTTGTGRQVYRVNPKVTWCEQITTTRERCLGSAVDAAGNAYLAHTAGEVLRVSPQGELSVYAVAPSASTFKCPNYPAFDRNGHLYLSDSGDWSDEHNGAIYKVPRGGGTATLWYREPLNTPNAIALDSGEQFLYYVETYGPAIARIEIRADGTAGRHERIVRREDWVPDGIAIDTCNRIWIGCHRPDAIFVFDLRTGKLELFAHDPQGRRLRGPTDVAFAGRNRDLLVAASLDAMHIHVFGDVGSRGVPLNHPQMN